jgi:hypothetical protein
VKRYFKCLAENGLTSRHRAETQQDEKQESMSWPSELTNNLTETEYGQIRSIGERLNRSEAEQYENMHCT